MKTKLAVTLVSWIAAAAALAQPADRRGAVEWVPGAEAFARAGAEGKWVLLYKDWPR